MFRSTTKHTLVSTSAKTEKFCGLKNLLLFDKKNLRCKFCMFSAIVTSLAVHSTTKHFIAALCYARVACAIMRCLSVYLSRS